jgi:hypothetical protein
MQALTWQQRQWASVNQVVNTLSDFKFFDILYTVISRVVVRTIIRNVNARYSLILPVLDTVACDCFPNPNVAGCFSPAALRAPDASCRADPSNPTPCAGAQGQVVFTQANFPAGSPPVSISTTVQLASGVLGSTTPFSAPRMSTMAMLPLVVGNSATYAVVKNSLGAVVGQLVGNGYTVSSSSSITYPLTICISISSSIDQDTATYPTLDFSSGDNAVGLPLGLTVTVSGLQYCASVPVAGTYYPIRRLTVWQTVQPPATTGSSSSTGPGVFGGASTTAPIAVLVVFLSAILALFF